ncbi:MAG: ABC transporter substrate-binding protein [Gammaproteobacteria bacterium]|nr:ABC transporter substrate-binding protein [Gammaproteobacteria bacterium]
MQRSVPQTAYTDIRTGHRVRGRLFLLVISLLLLGACADPSGQTPLRVGLLVWPPYELAFLARDLGYLDDERIKLIDFESPAVAQRAYREGAVDVVAVTSHYLLELAQHDGGHRVVLVIDISDGADALVARPRIETLAELKGKRIAVESSALGAYMLYRVLQRAELQLADVARISMDIPEQEKAYLEDRVDAVITYEPTRSRLIAQGARVLFDSGDIPDEIVDVLIARVSTIEQRREALQMLVDGWLRALDYLRTHPEDALQRMSVREGLGVGEMRAVLELVDMPDRARNLALLGGVQPGLRAGLTRHVEVMLEAGLLQQDVVVDGLTDPSLVREPGD